MQKEASQTIQPELWLWGKARKIFATLFNFYKTQKENSWISAKDHRKRLVRDFHSPNDKIFSLGITKLQRPSRDLVFPYLTLIFFNSPAPFPLFPFLFFSGHPNLLLWLSRFSSLTSSGFLFVCALGWRGLFAYSYFLRALHCPRSTYLENVVAGNDGKNGGKTARALLVSAMRQNQSCFSHRFLQNFKVKSANFLFIYLLP